MIRSSAKHRTNSIIQSSSYENEEYRIIYINQLKSIIAAYIFEGSQTGFNWTNYTN